MRPSILPSIVLFFSAGVVNGQGCSGCTGTCIEVSIRTDSNNQQTRYKLQDTGAKKWLKKGKFGEYSSPNTLYTETFCQSDSCFKLIMEDKGKNGLQNGGYYSLVANGETVVNQSSNFGKREITSFCTNNPQPVSPTPAPASPTPGTPTQDPGCEDAASFVFKKKTRDCAWVAKKKNKLCKKFGQYCPVTCNKCPATPTPPAPTPPAPTPTPPAPTPPAPTPTANPPTGGGGNVLSGKATFYGGNENSNACGYKDLPKVSFPFGYSSAAGGDTFDEGYGCGACFEITCQGPFSNNPSCHCSPDTPSVVVQVTDECPECGTTHFDLNPKAMGEIVGDGLSGTCGIIETQIRRVNCNFQSNIKIRSKSGTSGWWYGLHVDDVAGYGDIGSVRLKGAGRSDFDIVCNKSNGPSFWVCNIPNTPVNAPIDVELTDSAGRVLVGNNVITNLNGNQEFDFGKNFGPMP